MAQVLQDGGGEGPELARVGDSVFRLRGRADHRIMPCALAGPQEWQFGGGQRFFPGATETVVRGYDGERARKREAYRRVDER